LFFKRCQDQELHVWYSHDVLELNGPVHNVKTLSLVKALRLNMVLSNPGGNHDDIGWIHLVAVQKHLLVANFEYLAVAVVLVIVYTFDQVQEQWSGHLDFFAVFLLLKVEGQG
jgi:hypothetical protein